MRLSPVLSLLAALLMVWTLTADADAFRRRTPDVVEDALAYALVDRAKAIQILEDAIAAGPHKKEVDAILVNAGEQRRLAEDHDAAHRWFTQVLDRTRRGPSVEAARLGLALIEASRAVDSRVAGMLESISERDGLDTQNADRFLVLAARTARTGDAAAAADHTRKALAYAEEDPEVLARVQAALEDLTRAPADPDAPVESVLSSKQRSALQRAEEALADGRREEARRHAERALADAEPGTLAHRAATYMLQRVDKPGLSRDTIAVLLPLTGKYGAAGKQMQQALEFGFRAAGGKRRLLVLDTGSTPETAVAAIEEAVLDKGAIAVVGPLLSDETDAVVEAAEALAVPLFTLSRSLEDLDGLNWTLQAMMTPRDEIDALLDQVMDADGLRRFAIFAPGNSYGERSAEAFREAVEARGGQITAMELYDAASNDMVPAAQALGKKDYSARAGEFRRLKQEAEDRNKDPSKVVLPPVIDFEALFLPDNHTRVPLACAALAYEEFPLGDFLPAKDSPVIPLLGLSGWNHEQIVGTGGPYTRRGYFTDALVLPMSGERPIWTPPAEVLEFIEAYRRETRRTPTSLEAVVSDAGRMLAVAGQSDADTRAEFLQALLDARPEGTVTRVRGIDPETRRVDRELWTLTIVKEGILPRSEMPAKADY